MTESSVTSVIERTRSRVSDLRPFDRDPRKISRAHSTVSRAASIETANSWKPVR